MSRLWWEEYRDAWLSLTSLANSAPWDPPKGHKHRTYTDGTFEFHESEIENEFGPIEEQLWAFRHGLSDIVYTVTVKKVKGKWRAS